MKLVFLFGPAAVGKLTVGKALAARTGYPLFHNHLIVDAVGAVFPFGSPQFVRLRQEFWLRTFAEAAEAQRSLIFTFAPEPTVPADFVPETVRTVTALGGQPRFVRLSCSDATQDARVGNADRAQYQKLRSRDTLVRLRSAGETTWAGPVDLEIDTDRSTPDDSAAAIVSAFALTPSPPHRMFPD